MRALAIASAVLLSTVMKVREDLAPGDYRDPGWYKHPQGSVAYAVDTAEAGTEVRQAVP